VVRPHLNRDVIEIPAISTLSFSSQQRIRPMIETFPLANAAEAYGRMMRNEARFRIVLVTD
jgi:propanol-preferring alcohol dehydrogenase